VAVGDYLGARSGALRAHATQVDPTEAFWFGLSDQELADIYPYEDWILARSLVGQPAPGEMEDDLFAGVRVPVRQ
jgi:mycothiol S-conjugate amidase